MTTDDKIRDEKLKYDINTEAAKISALLSGKADKYEYLTCEEILFSDQRREIEQAMFTYSPLGKTLEKETKTIEDQTEKQKKQLNSTKNTWLNLVKLLEEITLISMEMPNHLKNKKKYFVNFLK